MTEPETPKPKRRTQFPFKSRADLHRYVPLLITRLTNRWAVDQGVILAEFGWNATMMRILASLSAYRELTINELSVLSVTEQSTTSRTTESLVAAGLVSRDVDDSDQRVRTAVLTDLGIAKLKEIGPLVNCLYEDLIKGIDDDELETCIRVLQQMTNNICVDKI